jgi:hypothetical protein
MLDWAAYLVATLVGIRYAIRSGKRRSAGNVDMSITIALAPQYDVQLRRLSEELSRIMTDAERSSAVGAPSSDVAEGAERSVLRSAERDESASVMLETPRQVLELFRPGLHAAIMDSRRFLALETDWDGVGSPGYREETWQRAVAFLVRFSAELSDGIDVETSDIELMPGSNGNIDFELFVGSRRLLFSVHEADEHTVRFFGHDPDRRNVVKGTLDPTGDIDWLVTWSRS